MKETDEQILDRVAQLTSIANGLCGMLMNAAVSMDDEYAAEMVFKKVRAHITMVRDSERMYGTTYYMERVQELLELSSIFKDLPVLKGMYDQIRDHYEVLLYNQTSLYKVLDTTRRQDTLDGLRENYWRN